MNAQQQQAGPIILAAVLTIAIPIIGYGVAKLYKAGLFQKALFDLKVVPNNDVVLVKTFKGTYREIPSKFQELLKLVRGKEGWQETIGMYYDDPCVVGVENCRYSVGLCVPPSEISLQKFLQEQGYSEVKLEKDLPSLHCSFPFTGMISVFISLKRVYPQSEVEMKKRGLSIKENAAVVEITREGVSEFYFMLDTSNELLRVRNGPFSS